MIHRGIVRDLSILPIDQHEACLEDLASLISIAEQFCLNHPLHYEITPPQIYQEFFPDLNIKTFEERLSITPLGWLKSESLLVRLYDALVNYTRIRCQKQSFIRLFGRANQLFPRIWWHGSLAELVYLIKSLVAQNCIPVPKGGNIIKAIVQNFCNEKGVVLKTTSLSTLDTRGPSSSSDGFIDFINDEVFHAVI